ncbi:MAG: hypothetical protein ACQESW_03750 [Bacteroidota bacterium]
MPQPVHFSSFISGAEKGELCVIAPTGQIETLGQGWFCGHI